MGRDERSNDGQVDLKPLLGLLDGLPAPIVEQLTVQAILEHRKLVERAEKLFEKLPAEVREGKASGGVEHLAYLEATIAMHAQMSALSTLLDMLGYTPQA